MSMDNNASVTPPWFLKSSLALEEIRPQSNIIGYFRTLPHHRLRERFVHPTIHHYIINEMTDGIASFLFASGTGNAPVYEKRYMPKSKRVGRHRLCICTKFCKISFVFEEVI